MQICAEAALVTPLPYNPILIENLRKIKETTSTSKLMSMYQAVVAGIKLLEIMLPSTRLKFPKSFEYVESNLEITIANTGDESCR